MYKDRLKRINPFDNKTVNKKPMTDLIETLLSRMLEQGIIASYDLSEAERYKTVGCSINYEGGYLVNEDTNEEEISPTFKVITDTFKISFKNCQSYNIESEIIPETEKYHLNMPSTTKSFKILCKKKNIQTCKIESMVICALINYQKVEIEVYQWIYMYFDGLHVIECLFSHDKSALGIPMEVSAIIDPLTGKVEEIAAFKLMYHDLDVKVPEVREWCLENVIDFGNMTEEDFFMFKLKFGCGFD